MTKKKLTDLIFKDLIDHYTVTNDYYFDIREFDPSFIWQYPTQKNLLLSYIGYCILGRMYQIKDICFDHNKYIANGARLLALSRLQSPYYLKLHNNYIVSIALLHPQYSDLLTIAGDLDAFIQSVIE